MIKIFLALTFTIAVLFFILFFSPAFKIKTIDFNSQNCLEDQKQLEKYGVFGKNLIFFDKDKFSLDLKKDFTCLAEIKITKIWLSRLNLELKEFESIVTIEGSNLTLTRDGLVAIQNTNSKLPTLFLPSEIKASQGQKIDNPRIIYILDLVASLLKSDFLPSTIRIVENEDIAIYSKSELFVIFTSKKEVREQVDSLQLILGKAKIDQSKIAKIDLRFDKPIISYK